MLAQLIMLRRFSKDKEVVAAATCTDFPVTDPEKISLIPRFIEQEDKLDGVQYFKRDNVGDKTRSYKLEEIDRPHGVICMAKNIEPNAKNIFFAGVVGPNG